MTQMRDPALDCHLHHSFRVLLNKHISTITGLLSVWWSVTNDREVLGFFARLATCSNTSITISHYAIASNPCILKPVSVQ